MTSTPGLALPDSEANTDEISLNKMMPGDGFLSSWIQLCLKATSRYTL